jgi:hypothetical protein
MTTGLPGINDCIPDRAMVSDYGNPPRGGNFRLKGIYERVITGLSRVTSL